MLLEAVRQPVHYRWPGGEIVLRPGQPREVEEYRALRLLAKANGAVRPIPSMPLEPGDRITWEVHGRCQGPAIVDFLHISRDGTSWAFVFLDDGRWAAVNRNCIVTVEPWMGK